MTEWPQYSECDKMRAELKPFRQALLFNLSNQSYLFPNAVVSYEGLDAGGEIWLTMNKPRFHTAYLEPMIPVELCFYTKEAEYFIKISGTALMLGINEAGQLRMRVRPSRVEQVGHVHPKIIVQLESWLNEIIQKIGSFFRWKREHSFNSSKGERSFGSTFLPEQTI